MLADRASEMGDGGADRAVYVRVPYLPDWQLLQDSQTKVHLPARTNDLSVSVSIRGFGRVARASAAGSGRIPTHASVRVEFESTCAMSTARILRGAQEARATQVHIRKGVLNCKPQ